jgi:hypothetical protein
MARKLYGGLVGALLISATLAPAAAHAGSRTLTVRSGFPAQLAAGGTLRLTGTLSAAAVKKGKVRVSLQQRTGGVWRTVRSVTSRRAFAMNWRSPHKTASRTMRLSVTRNGRRVAVTRAARVRPLNATVLTAVQITGAPDPGRAGKLTLAGHPAIRVGQVIAAGISHETPHGLLVRATAVSRRGGSTVASVEPTTLPDAIPSGTFDLADALPTDPDGTVHAARAAVSLGFARGLGKQMPCGPGAGVSIGGSVSLNAVPSMSASWTPLSGVSASFTETVTGSASVTATASASAKCSLKGDLLPAPVALGQLTVFVAGIPVTVILEGQVAVEGTALATSAATAGVGGTVTAAGGVSYAHGRFSAVTRPTSLAFRPQSPATSTTGGLGLHVIPELRMLLEGFAGPVLDAKTGLDLKADIAANPWWTLTAPLDVTAALSVPALKLASPTLTLYSHTFPLMNAGGPFALPSPAAPAPTSPGVTDGLPPSPPDDGAPIVIGRSILGASIGNTSAQVRALLGAPARVDATPGDLSGQQWFYEFADTRIRLTAVFHADRLVDITSFDPALTTSGGIGSASTLSELQAAYPNASCNVVANAASPTDDCFMNTSLNGALVDTHFALPRSPGGGGFVDITSPYGP